MAESPCEVRYQRVSAAVAALGEWATGPHGARLADVLAGDEVVLARMLAAAAVMIAAPVPAELADLVDLAELVDPAGLPGLGCPVAVVDSDLLEAANRWHRYSRSSAPGLHRACAADLARGLLRLWDRRRLPPAAGALTRRMRLRQTRITLLGLVRTRCGALRSELRGDIAALNLRHARDFPEHVGRRVAAVGAELTDAVDWELPGTGMPAPIAVDPPLPGNSEGRLGAFLGAAFGAAFGVGVAVTLNRVLVALVPEWAGPALAVSAVLGVALAGWVMSARRLLARRAALERWAVEAVNGLRAGVEEHIAVRVLAAEARESRAPIGGMRRFGDEPGGRSDGLAITDSPHAGANVQVRDG